MGNPALLPVNLIESLKGRLKTALDQNLPAGEKLIACLEGSLGEAIVVTEGHLLFIRSGWMAGAPFRPKCTSYPITQVQSIRTACHGQNALHFTIAADGREGKNILVPEKINYLPQQERQYAKMATQIYEMMGKANRLSAAGHAPAATANCH